MSDRTIVDFIEDWQTGALFVLVSGLVGALLAAFLSSEGSVYLGVGGFIVGSLLTFLLLSYLVYGR